MLVEGLHLLRRELLLALLQGDYARLVPLMVRFPWGIGLALRVNLVPLGLIRGLNGSVGIVEIEGFEHVVCHLVQEVHGVEHGLYHHCVVVQARRG